MNSVTITIDDEYIKAALMVFFEGQEPSEKKTKAAENYVKANLESIVRDLVLCNITSEIVEVLEAEWQKEWVDLPPIKLSEAAFALAEENWPDLADPKWLESLDKLGE